MKKTLFAMALFAISAVAQADPSVKWAATSVKFNETAVSGMAYIYFETAADTSWIVTLDGGDAATVSAAITEAHTPACIYAPDTAGNYTKTMTNEVLRLADDTTYQTYLVIFDTPTIEEGSHFMVTAIKNCVTYGPANPSAVRTVTFGSQSGATWYEVASATTPEPATATLSLLALAGLASRRRRH